MTRDNQRIITKSAVYLLIGTVTLGGVAFLLRGILAPVLFAFLLAYAFDPLVGFLSRRKLSRTLASVICLFVLLVAGIGLVALILPTIQQEINLLMKKAPSYLQKIQDSALPWIEDTFDLTVPKTLDQALESAKKQLPEKPADIATPIASILGAILSSTFSLLASLVYLVIIPLFTFYFLRDYKKIVHWFVELIPLRYREKTAQISGELDSVLAGFIRGQLTVCGILALFYCVFLSIASVPAALTIGIVAGLFNLVPYLGTITGVALSSLFLLLEGASWLSYLLMLIIFTGASVLDALLITPKVLGQKLGLAPVAVILAVLAFGEVFGFTGVLLAVPVTAIGKVFCRHALDAYRKSQAFGKSSKPARQTKS